MIVLVLGSTWSVLFTDISFEKLSQSRRHADHLLLVLQAASKTARGRLKIWQDGLVCSCQAALLIVNIHTR